MKAELERFGNSNDGAIAERPRRMLNITRDTGEFLSVLERGTLARRVLEIGTSSGYSPRQHARSAARDDEYAEHKVGFAAANFARCAAHHAR